MSVAGRSEHSGNKHTKEVASVHDRHTRMEGDEEQLIKHTGTSVRIYLIMRIAGLTNDQVMHTVNASQELKTHWDAGFLMGCDSIDHMSREAVALGCELECRETRL